MSDTRIDFVEGYILPVDKPYGWTSSDVVRKIRVLLRKIGYRKIKVGHAGTLDPLATGVLVICIGRATKQAESLQAEEKEYEADILLGATTPSFDLEHEVDVRYPYDHITEERVREVLEGMIGEQDQLPPVYSAKQIDGKRAYEYAREGLEVVMKKARITLYDLTLMAFDLPKITVRVRCSKGTYIRSLARDIGAGLESGGHLTRLVRTRSGSFQANGCMSMEEAEKFLLSMKQN